MVTKDISTARIEQQGNRVTISGKLDVRGACELYPVTLDYGAGDISVDLSAVEELESAGLALLVYWGQQAAVQNVQVTLQGTGERAENLVRIFGLGSMLGDSESREPGS